LKETEDALAFEKQMFSDLENKFMELQSRHTDAAAATFDSKRQTMAKSTDAASLRREIMAMETIQKVGIDGRYLKVVMSNAPRRISRSPKKNCRRSLLLSRASTAC
jgi:hypothetical protein